MTSADLANAPHQSRNFDPMAYTYVGAFDSTPEPETFFSQTGFSTFTMDDGTIIEGANWTHATYLWLKGLLEASPTSTWTDRGLCDHCGARPRYIVVVRHLPTGDHIAMGETCADTRIHSMDRATWQVKALRDAAAAAAKAKRTRAVREANFDAAPDVAEWLQTHAEGYIPRPLFDLRRMNEEGRSWVEAGTDLDVDLIAAGRAAAAAFDAEQAERAARKAERAAKATPAPEGRTEVAGLILSTKAQEGDYGTTWKMLVDDDRGFRVWSTIPSSLVYVLPMVSDLRGRRVTFTANLAPKETDPSFAIAKRPTKATLCPTGEEEGA